MAIKNPVLDDLANLMTGAMGAARTAGDEIRTAAEARVHGLIADMDLVHRDEIEVLKARLDAALERIDALEAEIKALRDKG